MLGSPYYSLPVLRKLPYIYHPTQSEIPVPKMMTLFDPAPPKPPEEWFTLEEVRNMDLARYKKEGLRLMEWAKAFDAKYGQDVLQLGEHARRREW